MVACQQLLPPAGRDFEIYRQVCLAGRSIPDVAGQTRISPPKIRQIVQKVAEFIIEVTPGEISEERKQQRLFVAEQVASERIDFLYGEAVRSFRASQGTFISVREVETPNQAPVTVRITRNSAGDCRYLLAAARLAVVGSKLPISTLSAGIDCDEETIHPPVEDCSVAQQAEPIRSESKIAPVAVSSLQDDRCAEQNQPDEVRNFVSSDPVQCELPGPSQSPFTSDPPLNRRQRKARERLFEKLRTAK